MFGLKNDYGFKGNECRKIWRDKVGESSLAQKQTMNSHWYRACALLPTRKFIENKPTEIG
tara:strand:+ start:533 stop:712 length:180 start_codon:yes stop_codon:yes gene_type:complete